MICSLRGCGWRETGEGASGEGPFQAEVLSAVSGGRALAPGAPRDVVSVVVTGQTGARLRGSDCQGPNLALPAVSPVTSWASATSAVKGALQTLASPARGLLRTGT